MTEKKTATRGKSKERAWLEEYSKDFGMKLVKKGSTWQLKEIETGKIVKESTSLVVLRDHVLRMVARYIGKHTVIRRG